MRNVAHHTAQFVQLHLAVFHDIRQGLVNDCKKAFSTSPARKALPSIGIDTREGFLSPLAAWVITTMSLTSSCSGVALWSVWSAIATCRPT